jgi:hypothetical protein
MWDSFNDGECYIAEGRNISQASTLKITGDFVNEKEDIEKLKILFIAGLTLNIATSAALNVFVTATIGADQLPSALRLEYLNIRVPLFGVIASTVIFCLFVVTWMYLLYSNRVRTRMNSVIILSAFLVSILVGWLQIRLG